VDGTVGDAQEFREILGDYQDKVQVVAFPCNQFGAQEPGTNQEIKKFAYGHGFTGVLMDKIDVNGAHTSPVFLWLKVNLDGPLLILPS